MSDAYAGLCAPMLPIPVENLIRGISKIFGPTRTLRITDGIGDTVFEYGHKLCNKPVEIYKRQYVKEWAVKKAEALSAGVPNLPVDFVYRLATCLSAIYGIDGNSKVGDVIIWTDMNRLCPQYWAYLSAVQDGIPTHNLAVQATFETWKQWVDMHATQNAR